MDFNAIVIDSGSTMIRVGFAGNDEAELHSFPPTIPLHNRKSYINADPCHSIIDPIDTTPFKTKGVITNWDQMESLWYHSYYNVLKADPTERFVLHPMSLLSTHTDRAKVAEISLETFQVAGTFMAHENMVTDYYKGTTVSLSVMINDETINIVPIIEGRLIDEATTTLHYGGKTLTQHLLTTLNDNHGCEFTNSRHDLKIARDIKEKLCYFQTTLSDDGDPTRSNYPDAGERSYELPDGQVITINEERYSTGNALFDPTVMGLNEIGLHTAIHQVINRCIPQDRRVLYNCIYIAGGTANTRGLSAKMVEMLQTTLKDNSTEPSCRLGSAPNRQINMRVRTSPGYEHLSCWLGGSIMGSLSTMSQHWITKKEWEEFGKSSVRRKCPL